MADLQEITLLATHYVLRKLQNIILENTLLQNKFDNYDSIMVTHIFIFLHIIFIIFNIIIAINLILLLIYCTIKVILWIIDLFYYTYTGFHITL
jgi:hypothetical protein